MCVCSPQISFVLLGIEEIGVYIEEPFSVMVGDSSVMVGGGSVMVGGDVVHRPWQDKTVWSCRPRCEAHARSNPMGDPAVTVNHGNSECCMSGLMT